MSKFRVNSIVFASLLLFGGCQPADLGKIFDPATYSKTSNKPSAEPITTSLDVIAFAQTSLRKLGYGIGSVDGIWGLRSADAMRRFEEDNGLPSAGGQLTETNLWTLELRIGASRDSISAEEAIRGRSIGVQLNGKQVDSAEPPLIITERDYPIMARANPFSEVLTTLPAGSGLYVLSLQHGWYEVESTDELSGYIKAQ